MNMGGDTPMQLKKLNGATFGAIGPLSDRQGNRARDDCATHQFVLIFDKPDRRH